LVSVRNRASCVTCDSGKWCEQLQQACGLVMLCGQGILWYRVGGLHVVGNA